MTEVKAKLRGVRKKLPVKMELEAREHNVKMDV